MHNKSLTVDNQVTLIGGRNIANVNVSKFLKGVFDA
jgi:phosphatidylserine/phosphatidylglycerophosphate/cardiolipin synthase-like enzyme